MIPVTRNQMPRLNRLKQKISRIKHNTKSVRLENGPFGGITVRIKREFNHFASRVPENIAEKYPPFHFDGLPDQHCIFVAMYKRRALSTVYEFSKIQAYEKVNDDLEYPFGYEQLKANCEW